MLCAGTLLGSLTSSGNPGFPKSDPCGYPDSSHIPQSGFSFNRNEAIRAVSPSSGQVLSSPFGGSIKVWYSDRHALLLGIREVVVKDHRYRFVRDYPISEMTSNPGSAEGLRFGSTGTSGDQAGIDDRSLPFMPMLFITDITFDAGNRSGDWQQGGSGFLPQKIFGTWKAAVKKVEYAPRDVRTDFQCDEDPRRNGWNLGAGSDAPPIGTADKGFGTEIVWLTDNLGLMPGHTYRLQFIFHTGEQNNSGTNEGEGCTTLVVGGCEGTCTIDPASSFILPGDSVMLTSTPTSGIPPYQFLWSTGDTTQSITVRSPGTFTVTVIDAAHCLTVTCQGVVGVIPGRAAKASEASERGRPIPPEYSLLQNYPNPFNPTTTFRIGIPERSSVRVRIFNSLGQEVAVAIDEQLEAGYHSVEWSPQNDHGVPLTSGIYLYRLEARSLISGKEFHSVKSMIYMK